MNHSNPRVSICVPTFNSALYLRQSLDSILSQSYKDFEVIVSDNASTDATLCILEEYAALYGIKVYRNEKNIGAIANFNRLVELASGEYTAIYHSDDIYASSIIEESVRVLDSDASIGLVSTMANVIDAEGKCLYDYCLSDGIKKTGKTAYSFDEALLGVVSTRKNIIFFVTPSVMVRTGIYRELGLFNEPDYKCAIDYEMWLRIARKYRVSIIDQKLMSYRVHEKQGSELEVRKNIELPDVLTVIGDYRGYANDPVIRRAAEYSMDRTVVKTALKQNYAGQFSKSAQTLRMAETLTYRFLARVIDLANVLHLRLHIWP